MLKKIVLTLGIVCFVIIAVAGVNESNQEPLAVNNTSQEKAIETIDAYGVVKAQRMQSIAIDFNATIESMNVKNGQRVNRGDTLLTLNMDDYFIELENKRVQVDYLLKDINLLKSWVEERERTLLDESDPELKKILKDLEKAEEFYEIALEDFNIKKKLFTGKVISKEELDKYEDIVVEKKYDVEKFKTSLKSCKKQLKDNIIRDTLLLNSKEMSVKSLEYEIASKDKKSKKSYIDGKKIISDMDNGVVYGINYIEGDIIDDDSQKILSIMDTNTLYIDADITEDFINRIKIGDKVTITPIFDKSLQYKGEVMNMSENAVERKGETTVNIQVAILENDTSLLPGFNVEIKIID